MQAALPHGEQVVLRQLGHTVGQTTTVRRGSVHVEVAESKISMPNEAVFHRQDVSDLSCHPQAMVQALGVGRGQRHNRPHNIHVQAPGAIVGSDASREHLSGYQDVPLAGRANVDDAPQVRWYCLASN